MVASANDFPEDYGKIIKIPGFQGKGLVCAIAGTVKHPTKTGDAAHLLDDFIGEKFVMPVMDGLQLDFEYGGEASCLNWSFGFHEGFLTNDDELAQFSEHNKPVDENRYSPFPEGFFPSGKGLCSFTENGGACEKGRIWRLVTKYECDNVLPKGKLQFHRFWQEEDCVVLTVVKTRNLCKHVDFSDEHVLDVKCVTKDVWKRREIRDLY
jgi:hypothetical protein